MQQCKVVQSGIAGSTFVVCQAEWPNMVVSLPKRQQRGATAAAAPGWGAFAYFAGQVVVFFFPLLAFS